VESRSAHARLALELAVSPAATYEGENISVAEVMLAYLTFAAKYYADSDGKPTKELGCMKAAIKPVRTLYGELPAKDFGPLALKAVRQSMVDAGLCRALVNRRTDKVKRVFKWAVAEELIPVATFESLRTLAGLRHGRTEARESKPVLPVADEIVKATLPHLPIHVRALVELMQYTGMRPSEACGMKLALIDRTAETWIYKPLSHKTAHAGKSRFVPLGPNARRVLAEFLQGRSLAPDESLFSPRRARDERFEAMRAGRKSKVQPSQADRRKAKPKRQPSDQYRQETVTHAVAIACEKAGIAHWHPYQLRHLFATRVRKEHCLEAAQVLLGHSRADVTQIYAERNEQLAAMVAAKIG